MSAQLSGPAPPSPKPRVHVLAGLTWTGIGLIVLLCLINALRRAIPYLFGEDTLSDWLTRFVQATGYGLIVAAPVTLAVVFAYNRAPRRALLRYPALALAVIVSTVAGVAVQLTAQPGSTLADYAAASDLHPIAAFIAYWIRYGLLGALFTAVFVYLRDADDSAVRAQEAERDRARFVQRMGEARLKMLQAQIEPHFLFNTLANVRRLYQTAPRDAVTMLDNLMRYFEVALPQMRAVDSTLGGEAELTESYLHIQRIRMGRRLAFDLDIPESLRDARFPPMMLLTLAENAIKHGLAPLPEGGFVRVEASVSGNELQVRVADTGRGFTQSSGAGTGLANIRARLAGMYGAAGRLTLTLNTPRGITATIAVPLSPTPSVASVP